MNSLEGLQVELAPNPTPLRPSGQPDTYPPVLEAHQRRKDYRQLVNSLVIAQGGKTVEAEPETASPLELGTFKDLEGQIITPKTFTLKDFLTNPRVLPLPFVVKDITQSRGNGKILIETPTQFIRFMQWANQNASKHGDKIVCQEFLEPVSSHWTTFRIEADWQGRIMSSSLWYGDSVGSDKLSLHTRGTENIGINDLADPNSPSYIRPRTIHSNRHFAGGNVVVDTGQKGGSVNTRYLDHSPSIHYISTQGPEAGDTLHKVGGIILLNHGTSQELSELEKNILSEHRIDPNTRNWENRESVDQVQAIMAQRGRVKDRVKNLYLGVDIHPRGNRILDINSRPTPAVQMKISGNDRRTAQEELYRKALSY